MIEVEIEQGGCQACGERDRALKGIPLSVRTGFNLQDTTFDHTISLFLEIARAASEPWFVPAFL